MAGETLTVAPKQEDPGFVARRSTEVRNFGFALAVIGAAVTAGLLFEIGVVAALGGEGARRATTSKSKEPTVVFKGKGPITVKS